MKIAMIGNPHPSLVSELKYLGHEIKAISRFWHWLRPTVAIDVSAVRTGVHVRRVTVDPVVLEAFGLRPQLYALADARDLGRDELTRLIESWLSADRSALNLRDIKLAVLGAKNAPGATNSSIVFLASQLGETLSTLFAGARLVINKSDSPDDSVTALEAMSYGKAVLKIYDLKEKLITLLADHMACASLGHSNRELVETQYTWEAVARELTLDYIAHYLATNEVGELAALDSESF